MVGFLTFRRMIAPALIQVVFWVGVVVVLYGLEAMEDGPVLGFLIIVGGVLLTRIWCELLILFFRMYETLAAIQGAIGESQPLAAASTPPDSRVPRVPIRGARGDVQEEAECRIELRQRNGTLELQAVASGPDGEEEVATAPCALRDFVHASKEDRQVALRLVFVRLSQAGWERLRHDDPHGLPLFRRRLA